MPGPGAGWAKGLGALQGSLALAPRRGGTGGTRLERNGGGVPGCHQGRARDSAKPSPGCHGPQGAVMDGASIIPDLGTCPSG